MISRVWVARTVEVVPVVERVATREVRRVPEPRGGQAEEHEAPEHLHGARQRWGGTTPHALGGAEEEEKAHEGGVQAHADDGEVELHFI